MITNEGATPSVHRVKLDTSGRIVLPADIRQRLGLLEGDSVLVVDDHDLIRIETSKDALREAQEYFASFVPPDVSLVDELIAERREEAARE
ncbi:MAG: AbrB/MazE/SpoVT family DNA-binding domain-containing protein [Planctomycetales bacterium]|nr:AbrB/MazE/SpoVT family DNA-binding domain-containing protein [Planctomycetales bacterium]